ncbi:MAG TPA: hypothetical protein VMV46_07970 [Thermoanaerobaculia bacterium]|nr:hypothetical protein [Thermoanaerobaculia bacterium]
MKGCLALLVLMVLLGVGSYAALELTPMAGSWGLAVLVAMLATLVPGNLWGLSLGVRRRLAHKPPGQWQDGDFVAFSGRITAGDAALAAPASGARCPIYEYRLERGPGATAAKTAFDGMAMAPTTVVGDGSGVRLVGFPLLVSLPGEAYSEPEALHRFAGYLLRADIQPEPASVRGALRQLGEILADEDGVLQHDQAASDGFDLEPFRALAARTDADDGEPTPEDRLVEYLLDHDLHVHETVVPDG